MFSCLRSCLTTTVVLYILFGLSPTASPQAPSKTKNRVEVVFCVDTTASMKELLQTARKKIWTISNQVVAGHPTPELRIGLVAFRDRSDAKKSYVTKVYKLTNGLDNAYQWLVQLDAAGGGDHPESVNQALHEAITKINWTKGKNVLRIIFLVGDAPPHMDYKDDVSYAKTCKMAVDRGIIINTIQCGIHPLTAKHWMAISKLGQGGYIRIRYGEGDAQNVSTPYDERLATLNTKLTNSTLPFGNRRMRVQAEAKKQASLNLTQTEAAERIGYAGRLRRAASYDLLQAIKDGKLKLEELRKSDLPAALQKLNRQQQIEFLEHLKKERLKLFEAADQWGQKRYKHLFEQEVKKLNRGDLGTFEQGVLKMLRTQAKRINVRYPEWKDKK
ncbi:MAG: hypothetical protein ACFCD0_13645 [Gemmataceae bacterium]